MPYEESRSKESQSKESRSKGNQGQEFREEDAGGAGKPHDRGYKKLLKVKRNLIHLLRKYSSFEWAKDLREEDITFLDKEFVTNKFFTYESDLICRIRRGEEEFFLFFILELQSTVDFTMPFRLLVYMTEQWEEYFKNIPRDEREKKEFRLPAVIPAVLYNGAERWTALTDFRDYVRNGSAYGNQIPGFQYTVIDVCRLDPKKILDTNGMMDNVLYLDRARKREDFLKALEVVISRVRGLSQEDRDQMEVWFTNVLAARFGEATQKFIRECFRRGDPTMISGFDQMINAYEKQINETKSQLQEKESEIQETKSQLQEKESEIQEKESQLQEKESEIQEKESQLQETKSQLQEAILQADVARRSLVKTCMRLGLTADETVENLMETFSISEEEAKRYLR